LEQAVIAALKNAERLAESGQTEIDIAAAVRALEAQGHSRVAVHAELFRLDRSGVLELVPESAAKAPAVATKAETSAKREPVRPANRKKAHRDGQFTRLSDAERLKVATIGVAKIAASIHSTQETVARAVGGHKIRAITAQAIRNELARGAK
jgi:hypothetical protein